MAKKDLRKDNFLYCVILGKNHNADFRLLATPDIAYKVKQKEIKREIHA